MWKQTNRTRKAETILKNKRTARDITTDLKLYYRIVVKKNKQKTERISTNTGTVINRIELKTNT